MIRKANIDALRGIAVFLVVLFHFFPDVFPGGYLGVDIFFVISGYLITLKIRRDFSLGDFYANRFFRIFPTLAFVLLICLILGWLFLSPNDYSTLALHTLASLGSFANHLFLKDVNYFNTLSTMSPLLHMWSLSVEVQFYLFFSILWFLFNLFKFKLRSVVLALLSIAVLSLILPLLASDSANDYFYLLSYRMWEFLAGALFAIYIAQSNIKKYSAVIVSVYALIVISIFLLATLLGVFLLDVGRMGIAIAVISSMIVLSGFINLGNSRLVNFYIFLGLISYPLYLWHWVIYSYLNVYFVGDVPFLVKIVSLLIVFAFSYVTHKCVELPMISVVGRLKYLAVFFLLIIVVFFSFLIIKNVGFESRFDEVERVKFNLLKYKLPNGESCRSKYPYAVGSCYDSGADFSKTIFLIGDSHMEALIYGFKSNIENNELSKNLVAIGKGGCVPFLNVETFSPTGIAYGCQQIIRSAYIEAISRSDVDLIVIAGRYAYYYHGYGYGPVELDKWAKSNTFEYVSGDIKLNSSRAVFESGMIDTIAMLRKSNKKVLFVHQVPELGFEPKYCVNKGRFSNATCDVDLNIVRNRVKGYRDVASLALKGVDNIYEIDPFDYFCDEKKCRMLLNDGLLYRDDDHVSNFGSKLLATKVGEFFITND